MYDKKLKSLICKIALNSTSLYTGVTITFENSPCFFLAQAKHTKYYSLTALCSSECEESTAYSLAFVPCWDGSLVAIDELTPGVTTDYIAFSSL